ncbi:hypothetical protein CBR_g42114 [Chara braunii]|uniref:Protein kinase domain-containing protein n=1 Tax=Chara braunii TaxID=69332 RepID=A0A388LX41_CHABU|nr:hypothetical protein CBR_g42114 [Chara braunii]|eukprot:GBG86831.1 hypothetical protein CBR_g42114 [Chara braunii]
MELETELRIVRIERQRLAERAERFQSEHEKAGLMHSEKVEKLEGEMRNAFEQESQTYAERIRGLKAELRIAEMARQGLVERVAKFQSEYERAKEMHSERVKQLEDDMSNTTAERDAIRESFEKSKARVEELEYRLETERLRGADMHPFREFSLDELTASTNDFHNNCKVKQLQPNGYGCVYVGKITPVEVRRLDGGNSMSRNQHRRLTRELVDLLKSLQHPHLQILLGVCYGGNCLVYEHLANGNVKDWVSSASGSQRGFLPWYIRLRIMAQVANALSFLHSIQSLRGGPIIHRAIKPENIYVDNNFLAKITDLDVALLALPRTEADAAQGMFMFPGPDVRYMAPELFRSQSEVFTEQTDIYAFGITILEILTGNFTNALEIMEGAVEDVATFRSTLDQSAGSWDVDLAMEAAQVGLRCASLKKHHRPSMTGEGAILPVLEEIAHNVDLADSIEDIGRMS